MYFTDQCVLQRKPCLAQIVKLKPSIKEILINRENCGVVDWISSISWGRALETIKHLIKQLLVIDSARFTNSLKLTSDKFDVFI